MNTQAPVIEFELINKWYENYHVLRDVSLDVQKGERIVICGPSGSGKSSLIRCVNGLEPYQGGHLRVLGRELTDDPKTVQAIRHSVGMVFQQFNLFPHLSVLENLTLAPIWVEKLSPTEAKERAMFELQNKQINIHNNSRVDSSNVLLSQGPYALNQRSCSLMSRLRP